MLAFFVGWIACYLAGGIYTCCLCHFHDKAMGNKTRPSILEVSSIIFGWPLHWYLVAREDISDFWNEEVSDEWKGY